MSAVLTSRSDPYHLLTYVWVCAALLSEVMELLPDLTAKHTRRFGKRTAEAWD